MIQVMKKTTRNGMDSERIAKRGVADVCGTAFAALGAGGYSLWPMTFTLMAMEISRLQPARRPSLPMKIVRSIEGGVGGLDGDGDGTGVDDNDSAGGTVASEFKEPPRVTRV